MTYITLWFGDLYRTYRLSRRWNGRLVSLRHGWMNAWQSVVLLRWMRSRS